MDRGVLYDDGTATTPSLVPSAKAPLLDNKIIMERENDEVHDEPRHDVHEPTTYELAEMELKAEEQRHRIYSTIRYSI